MAFTLMRDAVIMVGSGEVSPIASEYSIEQTVDTPETTTFGNAARRHLPFIPGGTFSLSGYIDEADAIRSSPGGISATEESWGAPGEKWVLVMPHGRKVGARCTAFRIHTSSLSVGGAIGDVSPFAYAATIDGDVYEGQVFAEYKRNTKPVPSGAPLDSDHDVPISIWGPAGQAPRKQIIVVGNSVGTIHSDGVLIDAEKYLSGVAKGENEDFTLCAGGHALDVVTHSDADTAPFDSFQPVAHATAYTDNFRMGFLDTNKAKGPGKIGADATDTTSALWVCVLASDHHAG